MSNSCYCSHQNVFKYTVRNFIPVNTKIEIFCKSVRLAYIIEPFKPRPYVAGGMT